MPPDFSEQLPQRGVSLLRGGISSRFFGNHVDIDSGPEQMTILSEKFPHQPFNSVAYHSIAGLFGHGYSEPRPAEIVAFECSYKVAVSYTAALC